MRTFRQRALAPKEEEGQSFPLSEAYTFRDFDPIVEVAYVRPMLTETRTSFQHKTAVKEYLERKTFLLPPGIPLSFEKILGTDEAPIAFCNVARSEVMEGVKKALIPILQAAINSERPATPADLSVRRSAVDLRGYQALKRHLLEAPRKSAYRRVAMA